MNMPWSRSITPEGWQEIYEACHTKTKEWLWNAANEARRQEGIKTIPLEILGDISQDALAEECYEFILKTNTCNNGGFKYWIDPQGYYKIEISG